MIQKKFVAWIFQTKAFFEEDQPLFKTLEIKIIDDAHIPGIIIDIETTKDMARITMWDRGWCDVEVLDIKSEKERFWEHYELKDESDFPSVVNELKERLK